MRKMSVSVVNIVVVLSLVLMLFVTANKAARESRKEVVAPVSTTIDTSNQLQRQAAFVPAHTKLHTNQVSRPIPLSTQLSVRNDGPNIIYLTSVKYFDKDGVPLKDFIESTIVMKPKTTQMFRVKPGDFKRAGDNFVVEWQAENPADRPVIKTISTDKLNSMVLHLEAVDIVEATP